MEWVETGKFLMQLSLDDCCFCCFQFEFVLVPFLQTDHFTLCWESQISYKCSPCRRHSIPFPLLTFTLPMYLLPPHAICVQFYAHMHFNEWISKVCVDEYLQELPYLPSSFIHLLSLEPKQISLANKNVKHQLFFPKFFSYNIFHLENWHSYKDYHQGHPKAEG